MRISDWSSDVCSSDLFGCGAQGLNRAEIDNRTAFARVAHQRQRGSAPETPALDIDGLNAPPQSQIPLFNVPGRSRTRGAYGKRWSVRVDFGRLRTHNTKKTAHSLRLANESTPT